MDISLYAIPAIVVLAIKGAIFFYARSAPVRDRAAHLYLLFLAAIMVQNIAEIGILNFRGAGLVGRNELWNGYLYFSASIIGLAIMVHLVLVLAIDWGTRNGSRAQTAMIYIPALILEILLWSGNYLIAGFTRLNYTYGQVAGTGYFFFEAYVLIYCAATLILLYYGARKQTTPSKRLKNKIMGYGMLPMAFVIGLVMTMQHQGLDPRFNTTTTLPIAITFFLAITAYAIHQYRLFDIDFYIPWSRVRQRKTVFYARIRKLIAEIAALPSVKEAVGLLAETFSCPIVLLDNKYQVVAAAGHTRNMSALPASTLMPLTHITVRDELASRMPEVQQTMQRHQVAAAIPFYPQSRGAAGWLLMGNTFSEKVYSPLDFKWVEKVFDQMADLFLERMLDMREEIDNILGQLHKLDKSHNEMQQTVKELLQENEQLLHENARLLREQPADSFSLISTASQESVIPATVTLLGRDKHMLKCLREHFPQTAQYVGPVSISFKRQSPPDVLICQTESRNTRTQKQLMKLYNEYRNRSAFLFYGSGIDEFIKKNHRELLGGIVETLSPDLSSAVLIRHVHAIAELRKAVCSIQNPDYPLIGRSQVFIDAIADAIRMSRFFDPVVIKSSDTGEGTALGAYIHAQSTNNGRFVVLRRDALVTHGGTGLAPEDEQKIKLALKQARSGCLMIDNIAGLRRNIIDRIIALVQERGDVRLIAGYDISCLVPIEEELPPSLQTFTLVMPALGSRQDDLQLLAHYFTLLYNLQADRDAYLEQAELESLLHNSQADNLSALKTLIFEKLGSKSAGQETTYLKHVDSKAKTLDEHVSEFETALISQTLARCDGNKSKAARLLGLRPNTLHYKMIRHGLMAGKKQDIENE